MNRSHLGSNRECPASKKFRRKILSVFTTNQIFTAWDFFSGSVPFRRNPSTRNFYPKGAWDGLVTRHPLPRYLGKQSLRTPAEENLIPQFREARHFSR